jgi:hypothetical protein
MLLRAISVGLTALRRIDAREPDPVLPVRGVENGDRVAVGDRDDFADQFRRRCCVAKREQQCGVEET